MGLGFGKPRKIEEAAYLEIGRFTLAASQERVSRRRNRERNGPRGLKTSSEV